MAKRRRSSRQGSGISPIAAMLFGLAVGLSVAFAVYMKDNVEVNNLEGRVELYVKNDNVEKLRFISSEQFLGGTDVASFVFKSLYESRVEWVRNAMTYYEINEPAFYLINHQLLR